MLFASFMGGKTKRNYSGKCVNAKRYVQSIIDMRILDPKRHRVYKYDRKENNYEQPNWNNKNPQRRPATDL
jgi:hypothetical protein